VNAPCPHTGDETACAECEDWHHDHVLHPTLVAGCFACKLRTVQFDAAVAGNGRNVRPRTPDNPWERGRAGEHRPDGTFMPLLHPDLSTIGVKEAGERRHEIESFRRQLNQEATTG
jgi:hypothetical protein